MIKISSILFSIALLGANAASYAQPVFAVRGGIDISSIDPPVNTLSQQGIENFSYSRSGTSYYGGVSATFKINKVLNLVSQANFRTLKYDIRSQVPQIFSSFLTYQLQQLNVRLLVAYALPLGTGKASIGIGPSGSYLLSSKDRYIIDYEDTNEPNSITPLEDKMAKLVPGGTGALKIEFKSGIFFEATYEYLLKVKEDVSLSVFEIGVGFNFRLPGKKK